MSITTSPIIKSLGIMLCVGMVACSGPASNSQTASTPLQGINSSNPVAKPTPKNRPLLATDGSDLLPKPVVVAPAVAKLPPLVTPAVVQKPQPAAAAVVYSKPGIRVSRVNVRQKLVALTFDDGPHPSLTPRLLDELERQNVKATFFVLGKNANLYPHIIRRIKQSGSELGNHSWNHPVLSRLGSERVVSELQTTADAVSKAGGGEMQIMRPPYGALSVAQQGMVHSRFGYRTIMWDVDPLDWKRPGAAVVARRMIENARAGSILLAHDIHAGTIDAMPKVISTLKQQGYIFVTVSELIDAATKDAAQ